MQNGMVYKVKSECLVENIAGQFVLITPQDDKDVDCSKMIILSESAAFVVNRLIDEASSFDMIVDLLLIEYNADRATIENELNKLLDDLSNLDVLEKS